MERRRDKRITEVNKIHVDRVFEGNRYSQKKDILVLTKDLSIGGARIVSDTHLPVGTLIRITMDLERSQQVVNVDGKIKWSKKRDNEDEYEMGIEFLHELSKTVVAMIQHLYGEETGIHARARQ